MEQKRRTGRRPPFFRLPALPATFREDCTSPGCPGSPYRRRIFPGPGNVFREARPNPSYISWCIRQTSGTAGRNLNQAPLESLFRQPDPGNVYSQMPYAVHPPVYIPGCGPGIQYRIICSEGIPPKQMECSLFCNLGLSQLLPAAHACIADDGTLDFLMLC